jgi:beta-galactosidase
MSRIEILNSGWSFRRLGETGQTEPWTGVDLPHSPFVSDLDGRNHWFGECEYRRTLELPRGQTGDRIMLYVGAAMQTARVFVNQQEIAQHAGGYLPFEAELTGFISGKDTCEILLRIDNRENADIPPGKPYAELDFCWYGGLYRSVELRIRPALHITEAISAGVVAGGGLFGRTLSVSDAAAEVRIETHVSNQSGVQRGFRVHAELHFAGSVVASCFSEMVQLSAGHQRQIGLDLNVAQPRLWSPNEPNLHEMVVSLLDRDGAVVDRRQERYGIRKIAFSRSHGFTINGQRLRLRGTNRHQEMPYVGFAVPRAAHYRDALRIKEAGFDYVRLSHYPQSPDFLDACDELGIVVMNCIPGWQFFGGPEFAQACCENARQLIRRDRNHACAVLWELSLNETAMDATFMARLQAIGHEEYPGDQMFTCGWLDTFDVFIHSRQHGRIHTWRNGDKALVIAEYGDWEYYANNAGFNQTTGAGVLDPKKNSRQLRGDGEKALRRQASNHIQALNDTLSSPAVLDGQWAFFDYGRGYAPKRAAVGVMDIFRLPKYSYHFYRSQRAPDDRIAGRPAGYNIFIASHWTAESDLDVVVFSNCAEVELWLNGEKIPRRSRSETPHLPHPPHHFILPKFVPGTLEAVGLAEGKACARYTVTTCDQPVCVELEVDDLGISSARGEMDVVFVHARILDKRGALCVSACQRIAFQIEGAELIGPETIAVEAGIASAVVRVPLQSAGFSLSAFSPENPELGSASLRWERNDAARLNGLHREVPTVVGK